MYRYLNSKKRAVVEIFGNWRDKYRVNLQEIEADRESKAARLGNTVKELGYANH